MARINKNSAGGNKWIGFVYPLLFALMALTGFAQMPIFKRYYIADIPGLGWLAKFYVTHTIHYLGAAVLFFIIAYIATDYFFSGKNKPMVSPAGWTRIAILSAVVVTGIFRVLKNLNGVTFSPGFTMFIDISHLAFMMMYIVAAIVFIITKKGWIKNSN